MLVLSRKLNEQVVIDKRIVVTVVSVIGNVVKLGFSAPHDVSVDRREVHDSKYPARLLAHVG